MDKISVQYFKTKFGELILGSYDEQLCLCDWRFRKKRNAIDRRITKGLNAAYIEEKSAIIEETIWQLNAYFDQKLEQFEIPLHMVGSPFQISVWNELLKIPYGKTETYLGLSQRILNEKAIRAVAAANGANPISIIVPCHRIIGSKGELTGYAGGIKIKQQLLALESIGKNPEQLMLF